MTESDDSSATLRGDRVRAAVVLVEHDAIALIERRRNGLIYFLFPGGGVEIGESSEAAAEREAKEELGLDVEVGQPIAEIRFTRPDGGVSIQRFFSCTITGGIFGTGDGEELGFTEESSFGAYIPVRVPLDALADLDVRPAALAAALVEVGMEALIAAPLSGDE